MRTSPGTSGTNVSFSRVSVLKSLSSDIGRAHFIVSADADSGNVRKAILPPRGVRRGIDARNASSESCARSKPPAPGEQLDDQHDHGDHKQRMNQAAAVAERNAAEPE